LNFDSKAVVLEEGASIDTQTLEATATRKKPYPTPGPYLDEIHRDMDYMRDFRYFQADKIPWGKLLHKAFTNAYDKSEYDADGKYCVIIKFWDRHFLCDLGYGVCRYFDMYDIESCPDDYSIIEIDYRYLFGLITGVYHWNNAEVGSQYMTTRVPDVYNRSVQRFLNFFTV